MCQRVVPSHQLNWGAVNVNVLSNKHQLNWGAVDVFLYCQLHPIDHRQQRRCREFGRAVLFECFKPLVLPDGIEPAIVLRVGPQSMYIPMFLLIKGTGYFVVGFLCFYNYH